MKRIHLGIAVLAAIVMVLMTSMAYANCSLCNTCGWNNRSRGCLVDREVAVVEEVEEMVAVTVCGPCGTKCTVLKPVKVKKVTWVTRKVQLCSPCGP